MNTAPEFPTAYALVTAAYNEEKYIEETIRSVVAQTIPPQNWVIVSDASTDRTDEIVLDYARKYPFITLSRITKDHPRNFAAQVMAINSGCDLLRGSNFEFIGNLDADVAFGPTYFQTLLERFAGDAELGVAGGYIFERKNGVFQSRPSNSTSSVPHAVQCFRRACFESVGQYKPLEHGGPDWFAEVRARMLGWKVEAFPDLPVHHFRPTNGVEGLLRGRLRQGRMDYCMGTLFSFEVLKCLRRVPESPRFLGAAARFYAFAKMYFRQAPKLVPDDFVQFLRGEQHQRLLELTGKLHMPSAQTGKWLNSEVRAMSISTSTGSTEFVGGIRCLDKTTSKHPESSLLEKRKAAESTGAKRVWIDMDNSPHVPFFAPIIHELQERGYSVFLTARDAYQVTDLVDFFHMPCKKIGRHYGKQRINKVLGSCYRALQLMSSARREHVDIAVSHGSRAQLLAASVLRIPSVLIMDYEFAGSLSVLNPTWVMTPEVIPDSAFAAHNEKKRVLKYPGIKEDVYVPRFSPDPRIKATLGIGDEHMMVTVRPPASEAHYHCSDSDKLFEATIDFLAENDSVRMVVLPRNEKQSISIKERWPELLKSGKMIIPDRVLDGLNLLWFSDLAISGGGTMNREAAALGVPVYSTFRGPIGAVDRYLSETGRLVLLTSLEDIRSKINLSRPARPATPASFGNKTLTSIVDQIVSIMETRRPAKNGTGR